MAKNFIQGLPKWVRYAGFATEMGVIGLVTYNYAKAKLEELDKKLSALVGIEPKNLNESVGLALVYGFITVDEHDKLMKAIDMVQVWTRGADRRWLSDREDE